MECVADEAANGLRHISFELGSRSQDDGKILILYFYNIVRYLLHNVQKVECQEVKKSNNFDCRNFICIRFY